MPETAVLFSGGLDSVVLAAQESRHALVHPLYVSVGFAWEAEELEAARRVLAAPVFDGRVGPLARLEFTMRDVYADSHWAIRGEPPAYDTPDEDVYLVGRNLVLLAKAGTYCALQGIGRISIGTLAGNPFPDARPAFFERMAEAIGLGLDHRVEIAAPLSALHKDDVVRLGVSLGVPLGLTLSCMRPTRGQHCGACSKCRERQQAFTAAGLDDPTTYLS